jgi:hypothetical protein
MTNFVKKLFLEEAVSQKKINNQNQATVLEIKTIFKQIFY